MKSLEEAIEDSPRREPWVSDMPRLQSPDRGVRTLRTSFAPARLAGCTTVSAHGSGVCYLFLLARSASEATIHPRISGFGGLACASGWYGSCAPIERLGDRPQQRSCTRSIASPRRWDGDVLS